MGINKVQSGSSHTITMYIHVKLYSGPYNGYQQFCAWARGFEFLRYYFPAFTLDDMVSILAPTLNYFTPF